MPRICTVCHSPIPIPDDAKFCPSCGARAEAILPPAAQAPASLLPDAATTQMDTPRAIAGRFFVSGESEESAVGTVLPARDAQGGAAVRVVIASDAALPSSALADRALREWKQLAKVATPKIVKIIDQGKLDDGKVYVVSAVPDGVTLDALVAKEGPLSIERIKDIVSQVGEALTEAQKVGVIHRDVAPRNVHVDGASVTVGEFGLAEAVNDKVFGSPAFLSPEQAEGKPVDQRSNIYSLGAVIYFMLTGKAPFEGSSESLLAQHVAGTPAHPSSMRASVPAELDRIVMKALEKSGGRRHLTLRQLITEVEAVSPSSVTVRATELGTASTLVPEAVRNDGATVMGMAPPTLEQINAARAAFERSEAKKAAAPAMEERRTVVTDVPVFEEPARTAAAHDDVTVLGTIPSAASTIPESLKSQPVVVQPIVAPGLARPSAASAPVVATPIAEPVTLPKKAPPSAGFRETAWFKRGEIDEELAKVEAKASADPLAPTGITGAHAAIEAVPVTSADHSRLSLKTGATQMMPAIKLSGSGAAQALPGERMNEEEMLDEIQGRNRARNIALVVGAFLILGLILYFAIHKAEPVPVPPAALSSVAAPVVAPTPALAPVAAPVVATTSTAKSSLGEAQDALAKSDYVTTVDALLRASRDGSDAAQVGLIAEAAHTALVHASVDAKKRHDMAAFNETRTLGAKLMPLLPKPTPSKGKRRPARVATRKR